VARDSRAGDDPSGRDKHVPWHERPKVDEGDGCPTCAQRAEGGGSGQSACCRANEGI
jgi:hypothetical protein